MPSCKQTPAERNLATRVRAHRDAIGRVAAAAARLQAEHDLRWALDARLGLAAARLLAADTLALLQVAEAAVAREAT